MRYIHTEVEINACTLPLMDNACTFTNAYQLQWNLSRSMLSQHIWVNTACNIAQTCQIQWVSTIWTQIVGTDLQHSGSTQDGIKWMNTACSFTVFTHKYQKQWIHTAASQLDCFFWTLGETGKPEPDQRLI